MNEAGIDVQVVPLTARGDAARAFLDRLPISPAEREKFAHGNAESLLRL